MIADLVFLARNAGLDETPPDSPKLTEDELALAFVCAWFRGLAPVGKASVIGLSNVLGVSRHLLYQWIGGNETRKRAVIVAREDTLADVLVEDAQEILDNADPRESSIAVGRANFRRWYAGCLNRAKYGTQSAPTVAINVAELHLAAHQARKILPSQPASTGDTGAVILTPVLSADGQTYDTQGVSE